MENQDNLLGVLSTLYKWRKRIITFTIIALVGSIVIALLLPNYYKATSVFYAASIDLSKPDKVFGRSKGATRYYGDDEEKDRILTLAMSENLAEFLIDSFDLYKHYDIDSTGTKADYKIKEHFFKLYNVVETKHGSLSLTIEDKDKFLARDMANAATYEINRMGQKLNTISQKKLVEIMSSNLKKNEANLKFIGDSLVTLRSQYGIYNIESQSELIASLVAKSESSLARKEAELNYLKKNSSYVPRDSIVKITAKIDGLKSVLHNLTSSKSNSNFNLKRFNNGIASVEVLAKQHGVLRNAYAYGENLLNEYTTISHADIPAIHILSLARTPNIKSKPHRSIIVLAATFAAFIFSCLGILLLESYRRFNWDTLKNA